MYIYIHIFVYTCPSSLIWTYQLASTTHTHNNHTHLPTFTPPIHTPVHTRTHTHTHTPGGDFQAAAAGVPCTTHVLGDFSALPRCTP